jgi:hypothetical protein
MTGLKVLSNLIASFLGIFLILGSIFNLQLPVKAQEQPLLRGLTISPVVLELEADQNKSYVLPLEIFNDTLKDKSNLFTAVQTFQASGEEGVPELRTFNSDEVEKSWVSFADNNFSLKAGEKRNLDIQVNVPENANPGSYFFATMVGTSNQATNQENTNVVIEQRLSALLFLTVKGLVNRDVNIQNFSPNTSIVDPFFDRVLLDIRIAVSGNSYLRPSGQIKVVSGGEDIFELNKSQKIILPNSSRDFSRVSDPIFKNNFLNSIPADASPESNLEQLELKRPWIGQKNFTLEVVYVDSNGALAIAQKDTKIIFFPWKSGIILITFLVILYLIFCSIKKFKTFKIK